MQLMTVRQTVKALVRVNNGHENFTFHAAATTRVLYDDPRAPAAGVIVNAFTGLGPLKACAEYLGISKGQANYALRKYEERMRQKGKLKPGETIGKLRRRGAFMPMLPKFQPSMFEKVVQPMAIEYGDQSYPGHKLHIERKV